MKCVLGFDDRTSHDAMSQSAKSAIEHRQKRSSIIGRGLPQVFLSKVIAEQAFTAGSGTADPSGKTSAEPTAEGEGHNDGFISLH
jgi:hypothetical protein